MILWLICVIFIVFPRLPLPSNSPSSLCASVYPGACQQVKRRKDVGENRIRPGGKRVKMRHPKLKDGGVKGQSLLTQVLDKGRFLRLGQSTTLPPGKNMELRCKGNSIGWSYPTYLDTFNDSRLRCCKRTSAVCHAMSWCECQSLMFLFSRLQHQAEWQVQSADPDVALCCRHRALQLLGDSVWRHRVWEGPRPHLCVIHLLHRWFNKNMLSLWL